MKFTNASRSSSTLLGMAVVMAFTASPVFAQWTTTPSWQITRVGLTDADHTSTSGQQFSTPFGLSQSGIAFGQSDRYGGPFGTGRSAWAWSPDTGTVRIGLYDALSAPPGGSLYVGLNAFGPYGQAIGQTTNGTANSVPWYWDRDIGTVRLGYFDGEYIDTSGNSSSRTVLIAQRSAIALNGQVAGNSTRFSSNDSAASTAWVWSKGSGTRTIGLEGAEYQQVGGHVVSTATTQNAHGAVVGTTLLPYELSNSDSAAWVWTAQAGTVRLGFSGPGYTSPTGRTNSEPLAINDAGQILGWSRAYDVTSPSLWLLTPGDGYVTLPGLTDAEHTQPDGSRRSDPVLLNGRGRVVSQQNRALGTGYSDINHSLWTWSRDRGTDRLGFTDAAHTSPSGRQRTDVRAMNERNDILGFSEGYVNTDSPTRRSAWLWSESAGLREIGLTDSAHTDSSGIGFSTPLSLNAAGAAMGTSLRYSNLGNNLGQSAWFYDPATEATLPLVFSIRSDGFAMTQPSVLTDDGTILGSYAKYSGQTAITTAFLWSVATGMIDLGSLVDGGLSASGWSILRGATSSSNFSMILGAGVVLGSTPSISGVFVLSVPSPSLAGAMAVMGLVLSAHRRRAAA